MPSALEADMIVVAKTADNQEIRTAFLVFLKEQVTVDIWEEIEKKEFVLKYYNRHRRYRVLFDEAQFFYTFYQRTGAGLEEFLMSSSENFPYRKEIFEHYLAEVKGRIDQSISGTNLRIIGLTESEIITLFKEEVIAAHTWKSILIKDCPIRALPEVLFGYSLVREFTIRGTPLASFPDEILQLANLVYLRIENVSFDRLPTDWSALSKVELVSFQSSKIHINDFSFVATMPKLKRLILSEATLATPYLFLIKKALPIGHWSGYANYSQYPYKPFLAFASAVKRSSLSEKDQHFFYDMVRKIKDIKELSALTFPELLKGLNINYPPFREMCLKQLEKLTTQLNGMATLKNNAVLHIAGKTTQKKTAIRTKLKELSIEYSPKFSDRVTHLLIGKNPKQLEIKEDQALKIITENQLQKFFSENQPQYLEQAAQSGQAGLHENLSSLLNSREATNVLLALEMLKTGGVPPEILEALLVLQKTNADSKVRAAAKKLLELYASADWLPLIRDKQHFVMIGKNVREQDIRNKLRKVAQKTSRDIAAMLSLALFKVHRRGLRYIFYHFKKPHAWRTKAFQAIMNGTHCDYFAGLGFTNLKDRKPENISLFKMKIDAPFPVDILEVVDKVESIDFHNCKLDKLHQDIRKFRDLKHLYCSCNRISKLPKAIAKLTHLETLDLSNNTLKEFPMEVLALKKLKKLDLRYMHDYQNAGFYELEVPKEVKLKLSDCEILV